VQSFLDFKVLSKSFFRAVPQLMRQRVRINGHLESIVVSNPSNIIGDANQPCQMTLKDYCILQSQLNLPVSLCRSLRQILRSNPA